jgi:hypothetical protein
MQLPQEQEQQHQSCCRMLIQIQPPLEQEPH